MAKYTIDRGTTANDGTGDNLRDGANKVNLNFDEIYAAIGDGTTLSANIKVKDDMNLDTTINAKGETLGILGGIGIVSTVLGSDVTLAIDATVVTASSTTTFINKIIDANGTGNSITNLEVADLASGVLDTDITSVSGSDDTLASAKAIKTYVDAQTHLSLIDEDSFATDSATRPPSQQSVKAYIDGQTHLSLIDEDNMATDSATRPPSQQSVKAYADTKASTGDIVSLAIALG